MNALQDNNDADASRVFLLPEYSLLALAALQIAVWLLWVMQRPTAGNVGSALLPLHGLILFAYIIMTPVLGLGYLHTYYVVNVAGTSGRKALAPVSTRFWIHLATWLLVAGYVAISFVRGLNGDVPFYVRVKEGPDTEYARAGFERLLGRPVPDQVHGVNFQNRKDVMDERQVLRFNIRDGSLVEPLVRDFALTRHEYRRVRDSMFVPGKRHYYTEIYHSREYTLYYIRETGDVKFEWFEV